MYKEMILKRIRKFVVANYTKIDEVNIKLGDISFNYKCHLNSVQKVKEGRSQKVYSVIAINKLYKNEIIVHFINQNAGGKYVDHTWGWLFEQYDYYIVREINRDEYSSIWNVLQDLRESLVNANSNILLRKIFLIPTKII